MTRRPAYEVLASNLHRLSFEQNLTLDDVAAKVGITREHLEGICKGEIDPDLDLVSLIAEAVGTTAPELLTEPNYH
ncbi:hypothetical protein PPSIR1_21049 [Plesiocystis pacifica SIR-1]|uniref:HTH cro/C1-type domain-containing protein n=1 Tax=Plesiocystis pacifica SIR-1 TaxID=391625 RepID=A6G3E9_9BACT|nr:helix-turn-helix transcriptional regulator [Plesiocystis pacifica]EDM79556.1 hypothetical protein PPSIR1_21049 [Plesiocystis pacifica SIR-1]